MEGEEDLKGKTINGFKVIQGLGWGGFGIVYLVEDVKLKNERFALKMMRKEKLNSKYNLRYEFTIHKVLNNPYIVKLLDCFVYKNEFFCFRMEYCEGGSLKDIIRINKEKKTTIDYKDTFKWSKEIINGLYYLHSEKIIHRDVKPGNLLLTKEKNAKLADFGFSKMMNSDNANPLTHMIGTLPYMSLEMKKGETYGYKTDIWSAGCVIFELVSLERFADIEPKDKKWNEKIPKQLIELMKSMLVKDQNHRYDSKTLKENLEILENITDMAEITYKDLIYNKILPPTNLSIRHKNFIGRIKYLNQIDRAFTEEKKQIIILNSISGTGKSSIANEIGHRFNERSLNQFVYWMRSDKDNIDEQFRQFAFDLKLITKDEKLREPTKYIMKKIQIKLKSDHLREQFLFILDNCDSIKKTNEYFDFIIQDSALTNVKFLITTTIGSPLNELDSRIKENSLNIKIESFEKEESISFIRCNLKNLITDSNQLNELIKLFEISGERPVILVNLIALVKLKVQSTSDLKLFIDDLRYNKIPLDSLKYNELFENLIKKKEKAWEVLKHSSFLDPDFIPYSVYTNLFKIDTVEFYDAIDVLIEILLVTKETDDEGMEFGIRIHKTLQKEVIQYLKNYDNSRNEFEELLKNNYEKIKFIFENKIETNEWNKQKYYKNFKKMIDHLLINENLKNEIKGKLSFDFATYSRETNLSIRNSLHYNEKSLIFYRKKFDTDEHIFIAESISGIANACSNLGRYEAALENYEKSMKICQNLFKTNEHSSIANIAYNMALIYKGLGIHNEALKNFEKSLAIYRKIHEYLPIALNLSGIGDIYCLLDRNKEALTSLEESLKICQKVFLTDEDPNIANILQNLALIYYKEGRYEEAIDNLKKSLLIYEKIYGSDKHSLVAIAQNSIADIYKTLGRYDEALRSFEKSLEINRIIFGTDDHLLIAGNLNNIGDINRILGRNHQALINYKQSLKISRKLLRNDDHHCIAAPLNNIGLIYHIFNRHDEALINFERSLAIYRNIFGTDENTLTAQVLVNIASVYYRQKMYRKALINFEKSIEIHRMIFGTNEHIAIATNLNNIGLIYFEQQIYDKAIDNFQKSLDMNLNLLGTSETVTISTVLENIARTYDFSGRHEEALVYLELSLDIRRKIFRTDDHPLIASSFNNLAVVYRELKNYKEGINCMFKFLKIIGNLITNLKLNLNSTKPFYDENALD